MAGKDDLPAFVSFTKKWHSEPSPSISPERSELSAKGKNVVVTGGGTGIGKAIATAFAQAGAKSVSILGRRVDKLRETAATVTALAPKGTEIAYRQADLQNRAQVDEALKSITDQFGKIDVFISNAGYLPPPGELATYDVETFMSGFELNVRTAFNAIQAFIKLAAPGAVLISISTAMVHFAATPGMSAYTVSKAANLKMVDHFATENPQLHVVSIQPCWTPTDLNGHTEEAPDKGSFPFLFLPISQKSGLQKRNISPWKLKRTSTYTLLTVKPSNSIQSNSLVTFASGSHLPRRNFSEISLSGRIGMWMS